MQARVTLLTYAGANGRPLDITLTDGTDAIDLSSLDIECRLWSTFGGSVKIEGEDMTKVVVGTNDAGEDGVISYTPAVAEIDYPGDYLSQVEIYDTDAETTEFSEPFVLRVQKPVKPVRSVASVVITAAGTGYSEDDIVSLVGGTYSQTASLVVASVDTGGEVLTVEVSGAGRYFEIPANAVTSTGGDGTGATFTVTWSSEV